MKKKLSLSVAILLMALVSATTFADDIKLYSGTECQIDSNYVATCPMVRDNEVNDEWTWLMVYVVDYSGAFSVDCNATVRNISTGSEITTSTQSSGGLFQGITYFAWNDEYTSFGGNASYYMTCDLNTFSNSVQGYKIWEY